MINSSECVICYVDEKVYISGAKTAMRYAKRRGLNVINIYREEDAVFYGMPEEQIEEHWKKICIKIDEAKKSR